MQAQRSVHNLPAQLTSFIGRERDLEEVRALLRSGRLVTLTGAGGVGKSRLALQLASGLIRELPDGAWLVELAAVTDASLVPRAVAAALGVPEEVGRDPAETLADSLVARSPLLVLDNCEHLVDACAALADRLLRAAPGLRILATSREALGIVGETTWRVPSLSLPEDGGPARAGRLLDSEAARLFAERAAAVSPGFTLTAQNAEAVAQVCRRLDGIPLAIELAAARVRLLSPEQIAARLVDRFRLLTGGSRTALPRQQTLRATIDWSYALLSEAEQMVLRRLSVFGGGWMLEAAEAVCAGGGVESEDVLNILARLVDKSIVQVETGHQDEPRYRLLETLRQYAQDRLLDAGEAAVVRDRHRDWFLAMAEAAEPHLYLGKGREVLSQADVQALFARLGREYDNLVSALTWSQADPSGEAFGRIAAALRQFWYHSGRFGEGRHWLDHALATGRTAAPTVRASLLLSAGFMARLQDDYPRATALFEDGVRLCRQVGDWVSLGFGLDELGQVRRNQGDFDDALAVTQEAREVRRQQGNLRGLALSLRQLGTIAWYRGELEVAERYLEEGLVQIRQLGSYPGTELDRHWLGRTAYARGDLERAREVLEESVALGRATGFQRPIWYGLHYLGLIARASGELAAAATHLQEALALYRRAGDREGTAGALEGLAGLALDCGEPERAARLFGAAECLRETIGAPLPPVSRAEHERDLAALRGALPAETLALAREAGCAMSAERVAEEAMAFSPPVPGTRAGATTGPSASPLSPREREVAALVARGLMNREIAAALVIAERTVETHVANILGKLGLKSRAQVGAWAERHGLLDEHPG